LLKIGRLSEQDLEDCLLLLRAGHAHVTDPPDVARLLAALDALPSTGETALAARRDVVRRALEGLSPPR